MAPDVTHQQFDYERVRVIQAFLKAAGVTARVIDIKSAKTAATVTFSFDETPPLDKKGKESDTRKQFIIGMRAFLNKTETLEQIYALGIRGTILNKDILITPRSLD